MTLPWKEEPQRAAAASKKSVNKMQHTVSMGDMGHRSPRERDEGGD